MGHKFSLKYGEEAFLVERIGQEYDVIQLDLIRRLSASIARLHSLSGIFTGMESIGFLAKIN